MTEAATRAQREYSAKALLGIAVPQANPIVEPEFSALAPQGVGVIATRLQGSRTDSGNRLVQYLENLGESLDAFDTARPDVLGFACTGTSYLVGWDEEQRRTQELSERFGYPILTAAQAIIEACRELGARRIALLAPYPQFLAEAGRKFWGDCGLEVVSFARKEMDASDTRAVYRIRAPAVVEAASALDISRADVVLLSGTGMPTLRVIAQLALRHGKPVLSSNLCLAWSMLRSAGVALPAPRLHEGESLFGGWTERAASL